MTPEYNCVPKYNFKLTKGNDYSFSARFRDESGKPLNLLGFRIKMHIRRVYSTELIDELSIKNGRIENYSFNGDDYYDTLRFIFPHEVTVDYPIGLCMYDLQIQSANLDKTNILEGRLQCLPSVTQ